MQNSIEQDLKKYNFLNEVGRDKLSIIANWKDPLFAENYPKILPNPYYRSSPWDVIKKSQLIESLIINIPIPHILLFEEDRNTCYVIDGQRRLETIHEFFNNQFALEGLELWTNLEGLNYDRLPYEPKRRLDNRSVFVRKVIMGSKSQYTPEEYEKLKKSAFTNPNSSDIALGIKVPITQP